MPISPVRERVDEEVVDLLDVDAVMCLGERPVTVADEAPEAIHWVHPGGARGKLVITV